MTEPPARRRVLHGRRKGHRLRARQAGLIADRLPELRVVLTDDAGDLDPRVLFEPAVERVWFEIGFGAGEHLLAQARANPDVGFIGCEPFVNGVAQLLVRIEEHAVANIRIFDDDARILLARLAPGSLERLFLLFPDPWPKRRHNKRRFVNRATLDMAASALEPGGEFRFASDIPDYVRWTLWHVRQHGAFDWLAERPDDWRQRCPNWPPTRYEAKALEAGRVPSYLRFRRNV